MAPTLTLNGREASVLGDAGTLSPADAERLVTCYWRGR
jgi:hypothetical protein